MDHDMAWYQEAFGVMKIDYQTRRHRQENEILVISLNSGARRVTYLSVNQQGVAVNAEGGVAIFADWHKGDRFERMYQAMGWERLPAGLSAPVMKWSDDAAWELTPPQSVSIPEEGKGTPS